MHFLQLLQNIKPIYVLVKFNIGKHKMQCLYQYVYYYGRGNLQIYILLKHVFHL